MTDLDHLDPLVGPALRERLRDERPDLEHLAASSLAAGRRTRRRHRLALSGAGAGVAAVAAVAVAAAMLGGAGTARDVPVAKKPPVTAPAGLHVGQVLDLGNGLTGTVQKGTDGLYVLGGSTRPGPGAGFVLLVSGPTEAINAWWGGAFGTLTEDWPGITVAVSMADADALGMLGTVDQAPVTAPAGWTCEWFLADDKASCTSADGGVAGLVIRPAAERDAWLSSSDKGADAGVYTTDAHDGIFISVQRGQGTTNAEVQQLGAGLVWVD